MKHYFPCPLAALLWLLLCSGNVAWGADKLTVLLDWFVNPDHAPLFVAQEQGYFRDRGLEVKFIAPSNPNDPPKLVAAGKADLAVSYQHQHQMQVDQGLP
ncbi:MAG: ABC transporter substrate-binding protein, partial [Desulfofustis sp.]|nr:ABC transporter substrate-binding protein [Desulfofustis sp.]